MAFALKGTGSASTANSTTADQASLVVTTATTAGAAGDLAVLIYALDNNQTTDGDENAVTAVTDSGGNQWVKAVEFTNGQGTAQTGATCGIWYSNLRAAIATGGTVTLTFSNATSRDATAASLTYYTKAAGFEASLTGVPGTLANDAAAAGSLNVTTANLPCLRVRGIASEALLVTALTPTATFAIVTQSIASTGVAATSMAVRGEWVINTGTGTASAPTAGAGAVDNASVYAAFTEVPTLVPREFSLPPSLVKRGLAAHQQQFTTFTNENFPSCGLVGVDTIGTALVGGSSVNTIDYTGLRVGGGANRGIVAMVTVDSSTTGMTAVWDQGGTNQSMTLIGTSTFASQTVAIFGLRNPTSGNKTLRFSWTTAGFPVVTAVSLITVDQSSDANAFKSYQSNSGNVSSLSVTVPSRPGDIVVGIGGTAGPTVTAVGTNSIYIDNTSVGDHSGAGWNAGATSVTFTGTSGTSGNWLLGAIDVSASPCLIDQKNTWLVPLSEPVRRVRTPNKVNLFPFSAQAAAAVSLSWLTPLSEPIWVRTSPAKQQVLAFAPNPVVATGWSVPLSEPARAKQRAIADYAYAPLAISEVVTIDKWFNPLADPARKAGLRTSSQQSYFAPLATDNSIALNTRFSSLIEPTRARARPTESPALFFVATTAEAETVTVDKWFSPFLDPVRKAGLGTGSQQTLAFVQAAPFAESVTEDRWHQPWSEPVRQRTGLSTTNQQALASVATVVAADAPSESWFAPLVDPVRRIPAAQKVNLFPFTAVAVVAVETVTVDKWFVSFTDPVRVKPQLATGLQQALAYVEAAPFAETVTESRWHQPWSEPLRSKPGLSAANQAAFFAPSTVIAGTELITVDKWFEQLSDPTRRKPEDRDHYKAENEFMAIAASMKWFAPLTDPVRQRQALSVANQRSYFPSLVFTTSETITVDKWFKSFTEPVRKKIPTDDRYLGENDWTAVDATINWINLPLAVPVRQKIGLSVTQQQALAFVVTTASTEVITVDKWFVSFTDPVRVKPALLTGRHPFLTWPTQIIIPTMASWWRPLAEPPKPKAGLSARLQSTETEDPKLFPNPARFLEGWFNWWSEPVRKLRQLNAALQRAYSAPDRNAVQATVTVTMAVTETNNDVALFAIKVYASNPPATAVVSLVEIGHGASLTSIVEEGDDGSGTSIVET